MPTLTNIHFYGLTCLPTHCRPVRQLRAQHVNQQCRCTEFNTRDRGPARRAGEAYLHDFSGMSGFETDGGLRGAPAGGSFARRSVTAQSRAARTAAVIRDAAASAAALKRRACRTHVPVASPSIAHPAKTCAFSITNAPLARRQRARGPLVCSLQRQGDALGERTACFVLRFSGGITCPQSLQPWAPCVA
jgi:hypothetical protein